MTMLPIDLFRILRTKIDRDAAPGARAGMSTPGRACRRPRSVASKPLMTPKLMGRAGLIGG